MRSKYLHSTIISFSLLFFCLFHISCNGERIAQNIFVSHLIYAPNSTENEFHELLRNEYLPKWRKLKDVNILSNVKVLKFQKIDSTTTDKTQCNYLILAQLNPTKDPYEYLNSENLKVTQIKDSSLFHIIRTEILACKNNAYFPALNKDETFDIDYLIEFIDVKDSVDYIERYKNLMYNYFGPLNGELVKEGLLYNIYMMETKEITFQHNDKMTWNQIHLSGDFPKFSKLNWDSLYTASFRRIISCELDSVWALMPPTLNTSFDCKGQLIRFLCVQ